MDVVYIFFPRTYLASFWLVQNCVHNGEETGAVSASLSEADSVRLRQSAASIPVLISLSHQPELCIYIEDKWKTCTNKKADPAEVHMGPLKLFQGLHVLISGVIT